MRVLRKMLPGVVIGLASLLMVPGAATALPVRTVVAFNLAAKQTPENVAIADDGTIYVSLSFAGEIRRIAPDGTQSTLKMPTGGGITTGIALDRRHGGDLDVAVRSPDRRVAGIWRVSRATFSRPIRITALPVGAFPNGITFDRAGNLYIADSNLGRIWRLAPGSSSPTVWSGGKLLDPTGARFMNLPLPGANGIKVFRNTVYVSNTSTETILAIRVMPGGAAGTIAVRFRRIEADDFAFAANGDLYVAVNPLSELIRISARGAFRTLAARADGLQNTSAVAFDPRPGRRTHLYITNSSYFGDRPSLQELTTRTAGLRLA